MARRLSSAAAGPLQALPGAAGASDSGRTAGAHRAGIPTPHVQHRRRDRPDLPPPHRRNRAMSASPIGVALERTFAAAGVRGVLHAVDMDSGAEVGLGADELVVAASVFKLPVLVELCRQAAAGELALTDRVTVPTDGHRTPGGIGLSAMLDAVELSLRDLSYLMMSISDNHATDVIVQRLGLDAINATMRDHGFPQTVLAGDCAHLFDTMNEDLGMSYEAYLQAGRDDGWPAMRTMRAATPAATNRTTPRETTRLLSALWRDDRFDPEVGAEVRRILALQVWPHRLAAGFPDERVRISGKTGTIAHRRGEAGAIELPHGTRYAAAGFVACPAPEARAPGAAPALGGPAPRAVEHLRAG